MLTTINREGNWYKGNFHTHTTVSDGELSPEQTARLYKDAGYDFLALTDHNRWGNAPLSDEKFLLFQGTEIDTVWQGGVHHIVGIGGDHPDKTPIPLEHRRNVHPQEIIDYILGEGGIAIYAHPFWSYADHALLAKLKGLTGMEIINYSCEQEWKSGIAEEYFEYFWRDGNPVWCFGSDDAHGHVPDYCGGYIRVKAKALTHADIIAAIRDGSFTASYGPDGHTAPELYDFYVEDGVAHVKCSPCRNIYINVRREYPGYHPAHGTPSRPLVEHSWELPKEAKTVKAILTGFDGSVTWSQPIRL